ncbi:kinase-like protein, partial [Rhizopogon salebrosus TDB-379]
MSMMKYGYLYLFSVPMSLIVLKALWREIGIWKRMRHDCIVPLLGIIIHHSLVSLVSPWMPNGILHDYLQKSKISSAEKYKLVCSFKLPWLLCILLLVHSESVVHGDLTSRNVLINEKCQACLTDFGLSSMMKIGERFEYLRLNEKRPGALHWSAPELIPDISRVDEDGERYTPSTYSDIYSYGCIVYEVLSGDTPWRHMNALAVCATILNGETPQKPHSIPEDDWVFILQCWLSLPSLRPPASQALKFTRTRISA